jgi:hypothetical protein
VSLSDLLVVYAPLLAWIAFDLVLLLAIGLLFVPGRGLPYLLGVVGVLTVGGVVMMAIVFGSVRRAMRNGILATAEVLRESGMTTWVRVRIDGRDVEASFSSRHSCKTGERLSVMFDPEKDQVMLLVGRATT